MRLTVTFEDGTWTFEVESIDPDETYYEQFEITDLNEARDTVWDLIEEISVGQDDPIRDLFEDDEEE